MAKKISELAAASALTGVEMVEVVQGGVSKRTSVSAILGADLQCIPVACGDETTAITSGMSKIVFHMPYDFTLVEVMAGLTAEQASGSMFTVDLNANSVSVLSTKVTIDNGESTSLTAAAQHVISDSALTKGDQITVDVDQVGDGTAKGLKVYLIGAKA